MQFIDLKKQYQMQKEAIDERIHRVLQHGQFIMGAEVKQFEDEFAAFCGTKHCISCANGTDALQIAFLAYGIGRDDAVFCPDITFIASVEPAVMLGAQPVFCDIQIDTYNICPQSLERQINAVIKEGRLQPKAVIAVDFLGNPANYQSLVEVCKKYNLILIEDFAQSSGASYHGDRCGAFGDIATTSFFPAKPLGAYGDGGAILTNDDSIADICQSLRVHGKGPEGKYNNVRIGMNSRLDTIQAAILLEKLKMFLAEIQLRQTVAGRYNQAFQDRLQIQHIESGCLSVYAQYALLAKDRQQRDKIIAALHSKNIPNMIYYPVPQHELPVFKDTCCYDETFKIASMYCDCTFSVPMHPYMEEAEQQLVIDTVREALQ